MHKTCIRSQNWTIDWSNMPESYTVSFICVGFVCWKLRGFCWKLRGFLCKHYSFTKLPYMPISTFTNVFSELRMESNAFHGHGSLALYGQLWTTSISELNFRMIKVFLPCISFFIIDINTCLSVSSSWMCQTCTHTLPCLAPSLSLPLRCASREMACKQVASDEKIAHLSQQVKWHCLGTTCQM